MSSPSNMIPSPTSERPSHSPPKPPPVVADWAIERWIKLIGRGPAALGRGLDQAAKIGFLKPILAPLSSVWMGITWLLLIGVYVGIGSGFASWRARFEMTDLEFFDAWPMVLLISLLAVNLSIVTLRRIPLTLYKAGVWTVHIGILILLGGCVWYFSQKSEGSVRIFLNKSVDAYYDATERALYAYKMNEDGTVDTRVAPTMTPLPGLPIYFEHLAERGNGMDRVVPAGALAGIDPTLKDATLRITGYYPYAELTNDWTAPADESSAAGAGTQESPSPGLLVSFLESGFADGKWFAAKSPAGRVFDTAEMPFAIEYLYHPTAEQLADVEAEFSGPFGLTVRVPKLGITKTFLVNENAMVVEGSPYTLTWIGQGARPLKTKGYEDVYSTSLTVQVARKDAGGQVAEFDRIVQARFPEIALDLVTLPDGGVKRVPERVDHDLQLTFHDAQHDQIWVAEEAAAGGEGGEPRIEIFHRKANGGKVERVAAEMGKPVSLQVGTVAMRLTVLDRTNHAVQALTPRIVPVEQRERGQTAMDAMQFSIAEVELNRGNFKAAKKYVPFVQFAQIGDAPLGRQPTVIDVPGVGKIGLLLSTTRRELPSRVKLAGFEAKKYPGASRLYEDYSSTLEITDKRTGQVETAVTHLNEPAANHALYYFQSAWDGDDNAPADKRFSVLGVGNRPGLHVMLTGALMIFFGIGYAFYVKPILLRKKRDWLLARTRKAGGKGNAAEV